MFDEQVRTSGLNRQDLATIREFREAVEDGAIALARRIWEANPDLHEHMREITLEDRP